METQYNNLSTMTAIQQKQTYQINGENNNLSITKKTDITRQQEKTKIFLPRRKYKKHLTIQNLSTVKKT